MLSEIKIAVNTIDQATQALSWMVSQGYNDGNPDKTMEKIIAKGEVAALYGSDCGYITYSGHQAEKDYFAQRPHKQVFMTQEQPKALPIGLRPKAIVDALRIKEILEAMVRYADDGKQIPQEWLDELSIINSEKV